MLAIFSVSTWQAPRHKHWCRALALLIAFSFLFPIMSFAFDSQVYSLSAAEASGIRYLDKIISLPGKFGTIEKSFSGKGKFIVHIQDLHCNYEVQKNIAQIIHLLAENVETHGRVETHGPGRLDIGTSSGRRASLLVGEEGGFGTLNLDALRQFPVEDVREEVSDYYVKQGKLTGAEYYGSTGEHPIRLEGIETPALYQTSFQAVRSFLNTESQSYVQDLRENLDSLKPSVYSPELLKMDSLRQAFRLGQTETLAYAGRLRQQARELGVGLQPDGQLERFLRIGAEAFGPEIEPERLFKELDTLDQALRQKLYGSDKEKEFDAVYHRLDVIEKLLNISATQEDLAEFRQAPEKFKVAAFVDFIQRRQNVGNGLKPFPTMDFSHEIDSEIYALDHCLSQVEQFYNLADQRSHAFVSNLTKKLGADNEAIAVMITGGFHTDGILAELQRQGIGYVSIKPRLTRQDVANPYFSLLQGKKLTLEKFLEKNQTTMAIRPWPETESFEPVVRLSLGPIGLAMLAGLSAQQRMKMDKYMDAGHDILHLEHMDDSAVESLGLGIRVPAGCEVYLAHTSNGNTLPVLLGMKKAFFEDIVARISGKGDFKPFGQYGIAVFGEGDWSSLNMTAKAMAERQTPYWRGVHVAPYLEKPAKIVREFIANPKAYLFELHDSTKYTLAAVSLRVLGLIVIFALVPTLATTAALSALHAMGDGRAMAVVLAGMAAVVMTNWEATKRKTEQAFMEVHSSWNRLMPAWAQLSEREYNVAARETSVVRKSDIQDLLRPRLDNPSWHWDEATQTLTGEVPWPEEDRGEHWDTARAQNWFLRFLRGTITDADWVALQAADRSTRADMLLRCLEAAPEAAYRDYAFFQVDFSNLLTYDEDIQHDLNNVIVIINNYDAAARAEWKEEETGIGDHYAKLLVVWNQYPNKIKDARLQEAIKVFDEAVEHVRQTLVKLDAGAAQMTIARYQQQKAIAQYQQQENNLKKRVQLIQTLTAWEQTSTELEPVMKPLLKVWNQYGDVFKDKRLVLPAINVGFDVEVENLYQALATEKSKHNAALEKMRQELVVKQLSYEEMEKMYRVLAQKISNRVLVEKLSQEMAVEKSEYDALWRRLQEMAGEEFRQASAMMKIIKFYQQQSDSQENHTKLIEVLNAMRFAMLNHRLAELETVYGRLCDRIIYEASPRDEDWPDIQDTLLGYATVMTISANLSKKILFGIDEGEFVTDPRMLYKEMKNFKSFMRKSATDVNIPVELVEMSPDMLTQASFIQGDPGDISFRIGKNLIANGQVATMKRAETLKGRLQKEFRQHHTINGRITDALDAAKAIEALVEEFKQSHATTVKNSTDTYGRNVVEITDHGTGITPEIAANMFRKGFSGFGSSGIGMASVAQVAKMYGIKITYRSTLGKGTTWTLEFAPGDPRQACELSQKRSRHYAAIFGLKIEEGTTPQGSGKIGKYGSGLYPAVSAISSKIGRGQGASFIWFSFHNWVRVHVFKKGKMEWPDYRNRADWIENNYLWIAIGLLAIPLVGLLLGQVHGVLPLLQQMFSPFDFVSLGQIHVNDPMSWVRALGWMKLTSLGAWLVLFLGSHFKRGAPNWKDNLVAASKIFTLLLLAHLLPLAFVIPLSYYLHQWINNTVKQESATLAAQPLSARIFDFMVAAGWKLLAFYAPVVIYIWLTSCSVLFLPMVLVFASGWLLIAAMVLGKKISERNTAQPGLNQTILAKLKKTLQSQAAFVLPFSLILVHFVVVEVMLQHVNVLNLVYKILLAIAMAGITKFIEARARHEFHGAGIFEPAIWRDVFRFVLVTVITSYFINAVFLQNIFFGSFPVMGSPLVQAAFKTMFDLDFISILVNFPLIVFAVELIGNNNQQMLRQLYGGDTTGSLVQRLKIMVSAWQTLYMKRNLFGTAWKSASMVVSWLATDLLVLKLNWETSLTYAFISGVLGFFYWIAFYVLFRPAAAAIETQAAMSMAVANPSRNPAFQSFVQGHVLLGWRQAWRQARLALEQPTHSVNNPRLIRGSVVFNIAIVLSLTVASMMAFVYWSLLGQTTPNSNIQPIAALSTNMQTDIKSHEKSGQGTSFIWFSFHNWVRVHVFKKGKMEWPDYRNRADWIENNYLWIAIGLLAIPLVGLLLGQVNGVLPLLQQMFSPLSLSQIHVNDPMSWVRALGWMKLTSLGAWLVLFLGSHLKRGAPNWKGNLVAASEIFTLLLLAHVLPLAFVVPLSYYIHHRINAARTSQVVWRTLFDTALVTFLLNFSWLIADWISQQTAWNQNLVYAVLIASVWAFLYWFIRRVLQRPEENTADNLAVTKAEGLAESNVSIHEDNQAAGPRETKPLDHLQRTENIAALAKVLGRDQELAGRAYDLMIASLARHSQHDDVLPEGIDELTIYFYPVDKRAILLHTMLEGDTDSLKADAATIRVQRGNKIIVHTNQKERMLTWEKQGDEIVVTEGTSRKNMDELIYEMADEMRGVHSALASQIVEYRPALPAFRQLLDSVVAGFDVCETAPSVLEISSKGQRAQIEICKDGLVGSGVYLGPIKKGLLFGYLFHAGAKNGSLSEKNNQFMERLARLLKRPVVEIIWNQAPAQSFPEIDYNFEYRHALLPVVGRDGNLALLGQVYAREGERQFSATEMLRDFGRLDPLAMDDRSKIDRYAKQLLDTMQEFSHSERPKSRIQITHIYDFIKRTYPDILVFWRELKLETEFRKLFPTDDKFWSSGESLYKIYRTLNSLSKTRHVAKSGNVIVLNAPSDEFSGGLMPWLRKIFMDLGVSGEVYDRWIAWLAENLLSIACGLSVAAILIFFQTASPATFWQNGYAAAWPIFFILHFLQMLWKGKAPPKSIWIPALVIALANMSLLFTSLATWQMFALSFVIHWYVNQIASRRLPPLGRYLRGVFFRPFTEFTWRNIAFARRFLLDKHNNKKPDSSWDFGKLIPRILGLLAMFLSPVLVPYLAEHFVPGILQYALDYLFGTDAGPMQLVARYILLPIIGFLGTHMIYNALVPWAQLSAESRQGWRKPKYLPDDRVYAIQTGPNAPVPCEIEFSKEAVDALGVTPQLAQRVLAVISRQIREGTESGRSLLLQLEPDEYLHSPGQNWRALKLKMVTYRGEAPKAVAYFDPQSRLAQRQFKVDFDSKGAIQIVPRIPVPTGGFLNKAIQEYVFTNELRQRIHTGLPLGVGEFTGLKFSGQPMGFVILALEDLESDERLGDAITGILQEAAQADDEIAQIEIVSQMYARISPALAKVAGNLRLIHGLGYTYESHINNQSTLVHDVVYTYDLEAVRNKAGGMGKEEFAFRILCDLLQMYWDLYVTCLEDVKLQPEARRWQIYETNRLCQELVNNYFTLADREALEGSRLDAAATSLAMQTLAQDALGTREFEGKTIAQIDRPFVRVFRDYAERLYEHPDNLELTPRQPGYALVRSSVPGVNMETYAHPPELSRRLSNLAGQHRGFEINYTGHGYTLRLLAHMKLDNQANDRPKRAASIFLDRDVEESQRAFAITRKVCEAKSVDLRQILPNRRVLILGTGGTFQNARNLLALAPGIRELVLLDLDLRNSMSVFSQMARLPEEQRRKITIVRADIRDYQTTVPFDVIYTSNTLVPELFGDDLISVLEHLDGMLSQQGIVFGRLRVQTEQQTAVPFAVLASEWHGQNQVRLDLLRKNEETPKPLKQPQGRNLLARDGGIYTLVYGAIAAIILLGLPLIQLKAEPKILLELIVFLGGRTILNLWAEWLIYGRLLRAEEHGLTYYADGKIRFRNFWAEVNPKFGPVRKMFAYVGFLPALVVQATGLVHEALHSLIPAEWGAFLGECILFVSTSGFILHGTLIWLEIIAGVVLVLTVLVIIRRLARIFRVRSVPEISITTPTSNSTRESPIPRASMLPGSFAVPKFDSKLFAVALQELEQAKQAKDAILIQQAREKLMVLTAAADQINARVYTKLYDRYAHIRGPEPHGKDLDGLVEFVRLVREFRNTPHAVLDAGTSVRDLTWLSRQKQEKQPDLKPEGIDLSPDVVGAVRAAGLTASLMDMQHLNYQDEHFQGVRCWASLHHLPLIDTEQGADLAVQEAYRVLKPGGIYLVSVKAAGPGREGYMLYDTQEGLGPRVYQFYTPEALRALLERNGFEIVGDIMQQTRRDDNWVVYARKPRPDSGAREAKKEMYFRTAGDLATWLEKISGRRRAFEVLPAPSGYRCVDRGEMAAMGVRDSSDDLGQHETRMYDSHSDTRTIVLGERLRGAQAYGIELEPLLRNANVTIVSSSGDLEEAEELLRRFPAIREITVIEEDLRNIDEMILHWAAWDTDKRRKIKLVRAEVANYQATRECALVYVSPGAAVFAAPSEKSEAALGRLLATLRPGGAVLGDIRVRPNHVLLDCEVLESSELTETTPKPGQVQPRQPAQGLQATQPGAEVKPGSNPPIEWSVVQVGKIYRYLRKLVPREGSLRPGSNKNGRSLSPAKGTPAAKSRSASVASHIELGKVRVSSNANILARKNNFLQSWPRLQWLAIAFLVLGFNLMNIFSRKSSRTIVPDAALDQDLGQRLLSNLPPNSIALADLLRANHGNPRLEIRLLPEAGNSLDYLARLSQGSCWKRLQAGGTADYVLYLPAELGVALAREMAAGQNLSWLSRTLFEQIAAVAGQNYYQQLYPNAEQAQHLQAYLQAHPNLVSHWNAAPALTQAWQLGLDQLAAKETNAAVYHVAHCIVHELLISEHDWLDADLIGLLQQVDPAGNIRLEIISGTAKHLLWLPASMKNNEAILGLLRQKYPDAELWLDGKRQEPAHRPRRQSSLQAA